MAAGCFSWCRLLSRWDAKKQSMASEKAKAQLAVAPVSSAKNSKELESDEGSFENTRSVVPTTTQYIMATGNEALALLRSAASVIPVPLLQDAVDVAIKIIKVCEEASAVQQKIRDLQERVAHLMIVIVDNVTTKHEEGRGAVTEVAEGIAKDVEDFLRTLKAIDEGLTKICNQSEWLQGLYTNLNLEAVDACLNQLSSAQEKFKFSNDLRDSNLLIDLQSRLTNLPTQIYDMHKDLKDVAEDVKGIKMYLSTSKKSATMVSSTFVRKRMPLKPEIFHGRDDLVREIAQCLVNKETARVCLLGPGGMGKTSVSLAVLELPVIKEQFPGENRVWVPCIEATSAALLLDILYVQLQVPGDKEVTLDKILSYLNILTQRCVILFDNFETPWNAPAQKDIEDILRRLANLNHIAIFITMRGTNPPCDNAKWQSKNIGPTENEACLRIYRDNNRTSRDSDADIGPLLDVLGYMPFAVTLMAKLARDARLDAKDLLLAWNQLGPEILSDNPEASMTRSIKLSVESESVKRNPNAIVLLSILSLLPAGTTKENLPRWTQNSALEEWKIPNAIAALSNAALLVENKRENSDSQVFSVVPVVQSFMQHGQIEENIRTQMLSSCCQYVSAHACRYGDPLFTVKSKVLAAEDANIRSILLGSLHTASDMTMKALIDFSWYRCDTKPDVEIAKHAVDAAKASGVRRHIVSAEWCLGWTYRELGKFDISYKHLHEAHRLSNDPSVDDEQLQRLHCQNGICLVDVAKLTLEDKAEVVSLAQHMESACATLSDARLHGLSLVRLGAALIEAGQPEQALEHLNRALIVLKAVNTPYLATAYRVTARAYYRARRPLKAFGAIQEACKLVESGSNQSSQASIFLISGIIHFSDNRDSQAWKHTEIALINASAVGNRFIIAQALELMGYGYVRKNDYENALGAYQAAAEKYPGTVDVHAVRRCEENMARIVSKQRSPDAKIGFERHYLDVEQSLFYPPCSNVGCKPIS